MNDLLTTNVRSFDWLAKHQTWGTQGDSLANIKFPGYTQLEIQKILSPFWPKQEVDLAGKALRLRDMDWPAMIAKLFNNESWKFGEEQLAPCTILGDGSVVYAKDIDETMLLDSCGNGEHTAWEIVDDTVDWHKVQAAKKKNEQVSDDHRSKRWLKEQEFWILEDCVKELTEAGVDWTAKAGKGKLQEIGAWLLDVGYTHAAVQAGIQHSSVQYIVVPNETYAEMSEVKMRCRKHSDEVMKISHTARRESPDWLGKKSKKWPEYIGNFYETCATVLLLKEDWVSLRRLMRSILRFRFPSNFISKWVPNPPTPGTFRGMFMPVALQATFSVPRPGATTSNEPRPVEGVD